MLGLGNTLSGGIVPAAASFANEYSLSFDGTDDYVEIGDVDILDGATEFTISFWINFGALPSAYGAAQHVISKGAAFTISIHNINSSGGGPGITVPGTVAIAGYTLSTSTWYHMAVTMVSGGFNTYINGALESPADQGSGVTIANVNTPITIAAKNMVGSEPSGFVNAIIDEVAIFDATRDLSEIQAIYNSGTPTDLSDEDDLVGYWRMEENTGTTVADSSSNSNEGTLTNSPTWSSTVPS
jgi:hypothetical protein